MLELFKRLVLIQSNCLECFLQLRLTKNGQKPFDTPFQLTRLFIRAIIWVFSGFYKELYLTQNDKERIFLCQCVDHLADCLDISTIHFMTNSTYLWSQRNQLNKLMSWARRGEWGGRGAVTVILNQVNVDLFISSETDTLFVNPGCPLPSPPRPLVYNCNPDKGELVPAQTCWHVVVIKPLG